MFNRIAVCAVALAMFSPATAGAQTSPQPPPQPPATGSQVSADKPLTQGELDALVAPIALYPDSLMSLVLMASTYPLEIVQADRLITTRKLSGDLLKAEVDKQVWDESVKSLCATPNVIAMMSSKLDWTQKLGDAVLAQQEDVMDAVQRLRARAQANDKLKTTKEQTVTSRQVNDRSVVVIEQADPAVVYVPQYNPAVAYGSWPYAEYPPYYFPEYGYGYGYAGGALLATGLAFGAGWALGRWAAAGNWWGGGANWGNRNLVVNRPVNINNIGNNWQHRPEHRHGVRYANSNVQQRFGSNNLRDGSGARQDFRGREGGAGDRANAGNRDRAGVADRDRGGRAGDRAGAGDRGRGGAGDRAGAGNRGGAKAGQGNRGGAGKAAAKGGGRPSAAQRPAAGAGRGGAFSGGGGAGAARASAARGQASFAGMGGGGGRSFAGAGGGFRGGGGMSMGGGGFRGGGGGFGGGRGGGGGRRSDIRLKHDIALLGHLDSGLGFYRFSYVGEDTKYVGVMAQDVQKTMPHLVSRDAEGYLRVHYGPLGVKFQTYEEWLKSAPADGQCTRQNDGRARVCTLEWSKP
jgi:hypothetical protein